MRLCDIIRCDLRANKGNTKGKFVMLGFRLSSAIVGLRLPIISSLVRRIYNLCCFWILNIEIPLGCNIGPGLCIWHGYNVVINSEVVIGKNVVIRQGVTIGNVKVGGGVPKIGNDVEIGCNSVVIGDINIGDGAVIGALTLVNKNVLPGEMCVGKGFRTL